MIFIHIITLKKSLPKSTFFSVVVEFKSLLISYKPNLIKLSFYAYLNWYYWNINNSEWIVRSIIAKCSSLSGWILLISSISWSNPIFESKTTEDTKIVINWSSIILQFLEKLHLYFVTDVGELIYLFGCGFA